MTPRSTRGWHRGTALLALYGLVLVLALGPASPAQAAYARIEGTGSTWSQIIVDQWIADVNPNGMQVVYTGGGSSVGRQDFANGSNDFAISEIPYQGTDENKQADASNRSYSYLPIVAGGTAFTYHLEVAGKLVTGIRLSGETIAKIFTNQITSWDDPAIKADNNGRVLPATPIIPVVRSDGSGTTAQLTTWLDKQYPSIWRPYFGQSGLTSYYPVKSGSRMISSDKSDGVMNQIASSAGNGTIGYVEYSYPVNKGYPVVKLRNAAGYYVEPTQYNVAVALTQAQINQDKSSLNYLTQILDGVYAAADSRAYPLSSYSYLILPTGASDPRMTTDKRQTLADFMYYSLCTGQSKAGEYGYSPLPLNLVQAGFEQLTKLRTADPGVDLQNRDVTTCNNPTFVAGDLTANHLADIAPMPADCDKADAGPCLTQDQAELAPPAGGGSGSGSGAGSGAGKVGTGNAGASGGAGSSGDAADPGKVDPETGLLYWDASGTGDSGDVGATGSTATVLAARQVAGNKLFGALAVAELLALVLVPGLLVVQRRRRRDRSQA